MPTVSQIIQIAEVSQYLSGNDIAKSGLYGGGQLLNLPRILYMVRKNVQWMNNLDSGDDSLTSTSNYLYSLCNRYAFKAQNILDISSGGTIAPVTPSSGSLPNPYDFLVSAISFIATGESTINIPEFIGYNVSFDRNGQPQYTTDPGDGTTYFGWNRVTGDFTLYNGVAQDTERFRITPIG